MELGSGCGILGVFLGTIYECVLLTDRGTQLPLLSRNIAENRNAAPCCEMCTLDWASSQDLEDLMKKMKVLPPLRAVYASDVLYDPEAVDHLVQLLSKLRPLLLCDDNAKIEYISPRKCVVRKLCMYHRCLRTFVLSLQGGK